MGNQIWYVFKIKDKIKNTEEIHLASKLTYKEIVNEIGHDSIKFIEPSPFFRNGIPTKKFLERIKKKYPDIRINSYMVV